MDADGTLNPRHRDMFIDPVILYGMHVRVDIIKLIC